MKRKLLVNDRLIEHTNEVLLAVLYARMSSDPQDKEGFSIPAQQKFLREYAQNKGIKVVREFIEFYSAKSSWQARIRENARLSSPASRGQDNSG